MTVEPSVRRRKLAVLDSIVQDQFVRMLPTIRRIANSAFRNRSWTEREELVAEVIANALMAFSRLIARGRSELAYARPLASFGVRQVLDGRRAGSPANIDDVSSVYCQRRRGIQLLPLQRYEPAGRNWQEIVLEDRRCTPCELAITRLDVGTWLRQLPRAKRSVAEFLASGERTEDAAKHFHVSPARISQLRRELQLSWEEFQRDYASRKSRNNYRRIGTQTVSSAS